MSSRLRILLPLLGAALLVFAAVRFGMVGVSSFQTEERQLQNGGVSIDHVLTFDCRAMILGSVGGVILLASFVISKTRSETDQM
jgi:hypothetical protein